MIDGTKGALLAELAAQEAVAQDLDRQRDEAGARIAKLHEQIAAAESVPARPVSGFHLPEHGHLALGVGEREQRGLQGLANLPRPELGLGSRRGGGELSGVLVVDRLVARGLPEAAAPEPQAVGPRDLEEPARQCRLAAKRPEVSKGAEQRLLQDALSSTGSPPRWRPSSS